MKAIIRSVLLVAAAICAVVSPAHAQKTKAQILTEIPLLCPIGGVGTCTAANAQQIWSDIVNAIMPTAPVTANDFACFSGTTGLLRDCSASTLVTSLGGAVGAIGLSSSLRITGGNTLDLATTVALTGATITANSFTPFTVQDAVSASATLTEGSITSGVCDPGYVNGPPGSGPCSKLLMTPNSPTPWGGLTLEAVNSRAIFASIGGVINPEIGCADTTGGFGGPIWGGGGGNQPGCFYTGQARIGTNSPVVFNISNNGHLSSSITASLATGTGGNGLLTVTVATGTPIVFGETFVGSGFTSFTITGSSTTGSGNCSPACTGAGGTGTYATSLSTSIGSEVMIGGPSGAEGSMQVGIFGGSLTGTTQNVITFFNASICSAWNINCSGAIAGSRLGEIAGNSMTPDGKFTQTETASLNFYAEATASGTFTDGSYTFPNNAVIRLTPNAAGPERITALFDYNANLLIGASGSSNCYSTNGNTISSSITNALVFCNTPNDPTNNPPGGVLYVKGGSLKYKDSTGTVTTLAP
jgi:hypothetical protein